MGGDDAPLPKRFPERVSRRDMPTWIKEWLLAGYTIDVFDRFPPGADCQIPKTYEGAELLVVDTSDVFIRYKRDKIRKAWRVSSCVEAYDVARRLDIQPILSTM